jgi:hypothetical protein
MRATARADLTRLALPASRLKKRRGRTDVGRTGAVRWLWWAGGGLGWGRAGTGGSRGKGARGALGLAEAVTPWR